jgi:hypothetical protein
MTSEWTTCVRRRPRTCSRRPLLVDWRPEDPGASGNPGHSSKVQAAVSISGGTPTNEYITRDDGPAIFFHGTEDPVVFFDWAAGNAATMYNLGIVTCLEPFERAAHGLVQAGYGDVINEQTSFFLYFMLDLGRA